MSSLLNVVYLTLLLLLSPWLLYQALRHGKYREGLAAKLLGRIPIRNSSRPCIWLHAVSVGEVNLLIPLLEELARERPDCECVVSTTTKTGYALARAKFSDLTVFYCPLDFSWAVRAAMSRLRPDLLVLAELELWPNLIGAAHDHGAAVAIVNGRLGERSFRGYRRIRPLVSRLLGRIDCIAVQNETYAQRFRQLGAPPERVHVTGSIKFDGAQTDRENAKTRQLCELAGFDPGDMVFLAGSTQQGEEAMALEVLERLAGQWPRLRLVLVPRHPERFEAVARMLTQSGHRWQRRSRLETEGADPASRILLVDGIGELGAWWAAARIAFVGGSLTRRGGQNMIEPAAYGAVVCYGPNTWNFRDVVEVLRRHDAAIVVHDADELTRVLLRALQDDTWAQEIGRRAREVVLAQQGATRRTCKLLTDQIEGTLIHPTRGPIAA